MALSKHQPIDYEGYLRCSKEQATVLKLIVSILGQSNPHLFGKWIRHLISGISLLNCDMDIFFKYRVYNEKIQLLVSVLTDVFGSIKYDVKNSSVGVVAYINIPSVGNFNLQVEGTVSNLINFNVDAFCMDLKTEDGQFSLACPLYNMINGVKKRDMYHDVLAHCIYKSAVCAWNEGNKTVISKEDFCMFLAQCEEIKNDGFSIVKNHLRMVFESKIDDICPICQENCDKECIGFGCCNARYHYQCAIGVIRSPMSNSKKCPCCREAICPYPGFKSFAEFYCSSHPVRVHRPVARQLNFDSVDVATSVLDGVWE